MFTPGPVMPYGGRHTCGLSLSFRINTGHWQDVYKRQAQAFAEMPPCAVDEPADKRNAERVPAQRGRGVRGDVLPAGQAEMCIRDRLQTLPSELKKSEVVMLIRA